MYCWKCGQRSEPGGKFCISCGSPLVAVATAGQAPSAVPSEVRQAEPVRLAETFRTAGSYDLPLEVFAGFWRRYTAYVVDSLVLLIPQMVINVAFEKQDGLLLLLQLALWWVYKATLESSTLQATLGKRALGIKVTDMDGQRISFGQATGRFFGMLLSAIPLGIGFAVAGTTRKRQALHDMLASCLVVRGDASPTQVRDGVGTMPMTWGVWLAVALLALSAIGIFAAIAIPALQR